MIAQPMARVLSSARRILLAGCGGGYDVLGAVPLYAELSADPTREVFFASLSFTYLNGLDGAHRDAEAPSLYEVPAAAATADTYCPEAWLAKWLSERSGRPQSVWAFDKTGVRPLAHAYQVLVKRLALDAVVLIDGGIDAILRGDESSLGTPSEDLTSLAAVRTLAIPTKILTCVGLGAEIRDGICHEQVFGRMAELGREGGYLGAAALTPTTAAGASYRDAVAYVFENQQTQKRSHVHEVISAAMLGRFGDEGRPHVWLSPLLNMYWFFDLETVTRTHLFLDELSDTLRIWDVVARIEAIRASLEVRERSRIPI